MYIEIVSSNILLCDIIFSLAVFAMSLDFPFISIYNYKSLGFTCQGVMMNFDINRHAVFRLQYHLIIVTKYRYKVIDYKISERLKEIAHNIFEESWKCKIIEIEAEPDHLHIAFNAMPQVQLSKLVANVKTVSSRLVRKEAKNKIDKYYRRPLLWSTS